MILSVPSKAERGEGAVDGESSGETPDWKMNSQHGEEQQTAQEEEERMRQKNEKSETEQEMKQRNVAPSAEKTKSGG